MVKMPTFEYPQSLIALFSEEVYCQQGRNIQCPTTFDGVPVDRLIAVQFLKNGRVCLTFDDPGTTADVLESGIVFEGTPLRLCPADT